MADGEMGEVDQWGTRPGISWEYIAVSSFNADVHREKILRLNIQSRSRDG